MIAITDTGLTGYSIDFKDCSGVKIFSLSGLSALLGLNVYDASGNTKIAEVDAQLSVLLYRLKINPAASDPDQSVVATIQESFDLGNLQAWDIQILRPLHPAADPRLVCAIHSSRVSKPQDQCRVCILSSS